MLLERSRPLLRERHESVHVRHQDALHHRPHALAHGKEYLGQLIAD